MNQHEIVLLAANIFDSEWIESSKKVLFEALLCKDAFCGERIPRFVSHYLDFLRLHL